MISQHSPTKGNICVETVFLGWVFFSVAQILFFCLKFTFQMTGGEMQAAVLRKRVCVRLSGGVRGFTILTLPSECVDCKLLVNAPVALVFLSPLRSSFRVGVACSLRSREGGVRERPVLSASSLCDMQRSDSRQVSHIQLRSTKLQYYEKVSSLSWFLLLLHI